MSRVDDRGGDGDSDTVDRALRSFDAEGSSLDEVTRARLRAGLARTQAGGDLNLLEVVPLPDPEQDAVPRSPGRRRWLTLIEVAAAVLVVIAAAAWLTRSGTTEVATAPAPISRDDLVVAAKGASQSRLTGDDELYRSSVHAEHRGTGADDSGIVLRSTQSWFRSDGSGMEEHSAESMLDGEQGDLVLSPKLRVVAEAGELDLATFSYAQLRALPSDPAALLAAVRNRLHSVGGGDATTASMLATILSLPVTPSPVRAASIDALFLIGAEPVGLLRGPDGRVGEGLEGTSPSGPWLVILDATTASAMSFVSGYSGDAQDADLTHAATWTTYGEAQVRPPG